MKPRRKRKNALNELKLNHEEHEETRREKNNNLKTHEEQTGCKKYSRQFSVHGPQFKAKTREGQLQTGDCQLEDDRQLVN